MQKNKKRNNPLNVLVCEDDFVALHVNVAFAKSCAIKDRREVEIYAYQRVNEELESLLVSGIIDIAILDVDLPDGSGLEIARELQGKKPNLPIIFITEHEKYKKDASDMFVVGFIEKPIVQKVFELLYERALILAEGNRSGETQKFLKVMQNRKQINIRIAGITSLEKLQRKVIIKCEQGTFEVTDTLSSVEKELLPYFWRVNQSVIVNSKDIAHATKKEVFLSTGDVYEIGITYARQLEEMLTNKR